MRQLLLALPLLLLQAPPALAQVSLGIGINLPGISIGIDLPSYPDLQRVPGYPVYYAPQAQANFFFYDGLYWVFEADDWYSSAWYNGPWRRVGPDAVPLYMLRVPVHYYRQPPPYFSSWRADAPPRWGEHWGGGWAQRRHGWDRWNHASAPPPAPLPTYQRKYPQSRYPQEAIQQQNISSENYRYRTRDPEARRQQQPAPAAQHDTPTQHRAPIEREAPPQRALPSPATPHQEQPRRGPSRPEAPPQAAPAEHGRVEHSPGSPRRGNDAPGRQKEDRKEERDSNGRSGR